MKWTTINDDGSVTDAREQPGSDPYVIAAEDATRRGTFYTWPLMLVSDVEDIIDVGSNKIRYDDVHFDATDEHARAEVTARGANAAKDNHPVRLASVNGSAIFSFRGITLDPVPVFLPENRRKIVVAFFSFSFTLGTPEHYQTLQTLHWGDEDDVDSDLGLPVPSVAQLLGRGNDPGVPVVDVTLSQGRRSVRERSLRLETAALRRFFLQNGIMVSTQKIEVRHGHRSAGDSQGLYDENISIDQVNHWDWIRHSNNLTFWAEEHQSPSPDDHRLLIAPSRPNSIPVLVVRSLGIAEHPHAGGIANIYASTGRPESRGLSTTSDDHLPVSLIPDSVTTNVDQKKSLLRNLNGSTLAIMVNTERTFYATAHEIGHFFGSPHSEYEGNLWSDHAKYVLVARMTLTQGTNFRDNILDVSQRPNFPFRHDPTPEDLVIYRRNIEKDLVLQAHTGGVAPLHMLFRSHLP